MRAGNTAGFLTNVSHWHCALCWKWRGEERGGRLTGPRACLALVGFSFLASVLGKRPDLIGWGWGVLYGSSVISDKNCDSDRVMLVAYLVLSRFVLESLRRSCEG